MQDLDLVLTKKNKTMKTKFLFAFLMLTFLTNLSFAQKAPKFKTVYIQTNAQCGDCKERLEGELNFVKGIVYAELHMDDKKLEVKYRTSKTDEMKIKTAVSKIGYDADDVKAVEEAQGKLPLCCQPGGH